MAMDKIILKLERERNEHPSIGHIGTGEGLEWLFDDGTKDLEKDAFYVMMLEAKLRAPVCATENVMRKYCADAKRKILKDFHRRYKHDYSDQQVQLLEKWEENMCRPYLINK